MDSTIKRVNKITQIVRLKQVMQRWKTLSLHRRTSDGDIPSTLGSSRRVPSGSLGVYVGTERRRFVIPTRFLNLPIFVDLLNKAEEEFGFQSNGGLVFPCEVVFFKNLLKSLERDEHKYGDLSLNEFIRMIGIDGGAGGAGADYSCKDSSINPHLSFSPLLQKARVWFSAFWLWWKIDWIRVGRGSDLGVFIFFPDYWHSIQILQHSKITSIGSCFDSFLKS